MHLDTDLSESYKLAHCYSPYTQDADNRRAVTAQINGEDVVPVFTGRQECDDWIDANLIPADYREGVDPDLRRQTYGITSDQIGKLGVSHIDALGFAWM